MITMLRRLFWLGLLGGAGYAGWTLWQRQTTATPAAAPEWPPMPSPTTAGTAAEPAATKPTDEAATDETATDESIASGTDQGVASISGVAGDLPDAATPDDTAGIIDAVPTATAPEPAGEAPSEAAGGRRWVDPLPDGGCPDGYPIKGNDNSGIYHVPGGRFYERTVAERCYATAEDAEADGYRAAKA